jgi:hypothetical protein
MSQPVELDLDPTVDAVALDLIGQAVTLEAVTAAPPVTVNLADQHVGLDLSTEAVGLDLVDGDLITLDLGDQSVDLSLATTATIALDLTAGQGVTLELGGEQGPPGPEGPPGPQGDSGGFYTHSQAAPSTAWTITHALGYRPNVTTVDSAGTVLYGDVTYIDDATIEVSFSWPTAGFAYLS